ncbi:aspartate aminotransferase [Cardiosporidium cionae]|uniref:Aspartate aminotransferase n=1 Tax=Cardiosporidium cionae TaxID=476202 RepID=A0A3S5HLU2_9APIC|nr:cytosolic aspartate aminotransferase [Cardiosporidium cionae]KAF8819895.1 aspartate aminotransferase [Cardiosporidium cionae]|eukprot:KAF8819895.1 aspartate aminotransferase [Cardiosporidium cionae]
MKIPFGRFSTEIQRQVQCRICTSFFNIFSKQIGPKISSPSVTCFVPQTQRLFHSWSHVSPAPPDPILGLTMDFRQDMHPNKVDLGVGAYRDDNGQPWILESVKLAEMKRHQEMISSISSPLNPDGILFSKNHEYLPIAGSKRFVELAVALAYGPCIENRSIVACQSLSGTGALRLAAEWLKNFAQDKILIPNPTWPNHHNIFSRAGFTITAYRYWHAQNLELDLEGLLTDLQEAPSGRIVLLHVCAHNPTGCDPTPDQWKAIEKVVAEKNHLVLFDMAYQGFSSGDPDKDAWAVRYFVEKGHSVLLCQSFAKNMGLYGQRVGTFSFLCKDEAERKACESQLYRIIRSIYSSPPIFGAEIVQYVLENETFRKRWQNDLIEMSQRIQSMRSNLFTILRDRYNLSWEHIMKQAGMFAYTGLSQEQVQKLRETHIYMTADGRISIAGLNTKNIEYVASKFAEVASA